MILKGPALGCKVRGSFVGILEHRHIVVLQIKKSGADKPDEPGDGLGRVHLLAVDRDGVPHDPGIVRIRPGAAPRARARRREALQVGGEDRTDRARDGRAADVACGAAEKDRCVRLEVRRRTVRAVNPTHAIAPPPSGRARRF
jgi:hypothetical protein